MKNIFSYDESENSLAIMPETVIHANRELSADSVKEMIEYTPEKVKFVLGKMTVTVSGADLEISSFGTERLRLTGDILSVSFSS